MTDLSALSLAELEVLVAAEKERRRASALSELTHIAGEYGFALSDLVAVAAKKRRPRRSHTEVRAKLDQLIKAGATVSEIKDAMGYANMGSTYAILSARGFRVRDGKPYSVAH